MPEEPFVPGVDPGLKSWLQMRSSLKEARLKGQQFETITSRIKYKSRLFWNTQIPRGTPSDDTSIFKSPQISSPCRDDDESDSENVDDRSTAIPCPDMEKFIAMMETPSMKCREIVNAVVSAQHLRFLEYVISESDFDLNSRDEHGQTMLIVATMLGDFEKVEFLLTNTDGGGLELNTRDNIGQTALHMAMTNPARFHPPKLATMLIEHGADVNIQCNRGHTPLHR